MSVKLVHVTTVPVSLWAFFGGQIGYMRARGLQVEAISSPGEFLDRFAAREQIPVHAVAFRRSISPLADVVALTRLWRTLRSIRPQIVHSHTPKGGLLGMLAGWLAGVPVRIFHLHGMPVAEAKGVKGRLALWATWLSCFCADRVLCVSHSLRNTAIAEGLCRAEKIKVLCNGSCNGIDAAGYFNPLRFGDQDRLRVRRQYGIPDDALVVGFLGRIVRDKGLIELTSAWRRLREEFPSLHLLVAGALEPQDPVPAEVIETLRTDPRVHLTGLVDDVAPLYTAMDLCVLPTYREGFGLVLTEAAAMGLPAVSTRVPGCMDAVVDGVTGTLVPARDADALAQATRAYLTDEPLRRQHGTAGRERVLREFRQADLWSALYDEYTGLLQDHGVALPAVEPAVDRSRS